MNTQYNLFMIGAFVIIAVVYALDTVLRRAPERLPRAVKDFGAKPYRVEICIFIIAAAILFALNGNKHIFYNNYSYLANAFLHGRLDTPDLPEYLESVEFGGYKYMHFAPGPAVLSIPFVALFGVDGFNAGYLCMLLGAANCVLFYKVICNMKIGETMRDRLWFTAFACFGTVHLFLAAVAHSWFFGHISTWFFLLFSMYFITKENPKNQNVFCLVGGVFFGMAVTCRLSNLLAAVFLLGYIWLYKPDKLKNAALFCCGAAVPGGLYMLYNFVRFGTIMDKSYNLTHLKDYFRDKYDLMQTLPTKEQQLKYLNYTEKDVGGPLQPQFIKYNLYSIFLMMPEFTSGYPYAVPLKTGVCITILSPALYFLFAADWKKKITWLLAVTMVLSAVPFLMNYGNGMAQFGMRYAMDFLPYMIILACMGMKSVGGIKALIISYCMFANVWGPIYWRFFYL